MVASLDNIRGLTLAMSSSAFIGSSFVIKKIGLKKAGDSGVRAGCAPSCNYLTRLTLSCIASESSNASDIYGILMIYWIYACMDVSIYIVQLLNNFDFLC